MNSYHLSTVFVYFRFCSPSSFGSVMRFCSFAVRQIYKGRFTYGKSYYCPVDENGIALDLKDHTKLDIYINALTD
ncbi:MAG: hypothetical protein IKD68_00850, partial [Solobacterium sp.]|nr:hypothetical protein [Solobacterium sp.]